MPRQYHNARQLPADRSPKTMNVKISELIKVKCTCGYDGPAKMITGRSVHPIYLCENCNRTAQRIEAKK